MTRKPVTIVTFDWLPDFPRGYMRDLRARWAAEETGTPYLIETVPIGENGPLHLAMQPFGQMPALKDGDMTLFESGAIALHLTEGTPLLPETRRAEITQWLIAALNSVEPASQQWGNMNMSEQHPQIFGPASTPEVKEHARQHLLKRLAALEARMQDRDWIIGSFSVADILLVDVLRVPHAMGALEEFPSLTAYVARATARPAFQKAMADHMAHWSTADAARAAQQQEKTS